MQETFANEQTNAVILIDAKNAFNSLNRNVALHNIQIACPPFSTIMINTCRHSSRLIVFEAKDTLSEEGTTQGDNLAMSFYALGLASLLRRLRITTPSVREVWLADDATGAGLLIDLRNWWDELIEPGSHCGYYVNEAKSWMILKHGNKLLQVQTMFKETNINFTTEGKRHLGAALRSKNVRDEYASCKVSDWCDELDRLLKLQNLNLKQPTQHLFMGNKESSTIS